MTGTPEFLIEKPFPNAAVPGPAGSDVLSDAFRLFRVTGAALLRGEFTEAWAWEAPPASAIADMLHPGAKRMLLLHIIAQGSCWVEADGIPRQTLEEGTIVGFPLGHAHRMGAGSNTRTVPVASLFPPLPWTDLPVLRHGGSGPLTRLVCVYLHCDELLFNPILSNMPALLIVPPGEGAATRWIEASVPYIIADALPHALASATRGSGPAEQ